MDRTIRCGTIQARLMGMEKAKVVLLVRGEKGTGKLPATVQTNSLPRTRTMCAGR